jgi:hypothetical protein
VSNQENQNLRTLQPGQNSGSSTNSYDYSSIKATQSVTSTETISSALEASAADTSVVYVSGSGVATIDSVKLSKKGGDSSNTENSEFYGVNAALLVNGATATLTNTNITTAVTGANAVFATNSGSITITGGTITSTGSSSARGLDATYGGKITASGLTINTSGGSCASLATDRGEGTVSCTSCTLTTNGAGSPVIYSTGVISITDSTGTANGAQMVVVEGKNSATVTSSTLKCTGVGNRNNVDKCGVMIYQSQSGDADDGNGSFTATNSKMEIVSSSSVYSTAPMFFVTNTEATITLSNVTFTYGSGIFLDIEGTDQWGTSGSNGGDVTMTVTGQTIAGNIVIDDYSSLTLTLKSSSSFTGTINGAGSSGTINIVIDESSTITLTGDSTITKLTNSDSTGSNIKGDYSFSYSDSSGSDGKGNYLQFYVLNLLLIIMIL